VRGSIATSVLVVVLANAGCSRDSRTPVVRAASAEVRAPSAPVVTGDAEATRSISSPATSPDAGSPASTASHDDCVRRRGATRRTSRCIRDPGPFRRDGGLPEY